MLMLYFLYNEFHPEAVKLQNHVHFGCFSHMASENFKFLRLTLSLTTNYVHCMKEQHEHPT